MNVRGSEEILSGEKSTQVIKTNRKPSEAEVAVAEEITEVTQEERAKEEAGARVIS